MPNCKKKKYTQTDREKICRAFGHFWRPGRPGESENIRYADGRSHLFRTCNVCSKTEQLKQDWETA